MRLRYEGLPTGEVDYLRGGGLDANGQEPLSRVADSSANPCRHCLGLIAPGDEKLVLCYRPFAAPQPYAESGPIFLHGASCTRYAGECLPAWFAFMDAAAVRGYDHDDWIRYDTGRIVSGAKLEETCAAILRDASISYVHIRSKFGCYQCRVARA